MIHTRKLRRLAAVRYLWFAFWSKKQWEPCCKESPGQAWQVNMLDISVAIANRSTHSSLPVDDKVVSSIGKGVCVLVGIGTDDTEKDMDYIINKILNIRVFDQDGAMWKKGVKDLGLEVLCGKREKWSVIGGRKLTLLHPVSQFTLQGKTQKGLRKQQQQGYPYALVS